MRDIVRAVVVGMVCLAAAAFPGETRASTAPPDTALSLTTFLLALQETEALLAGADSIAPLPPARVRAWQTGLLRADRIQHASLSLASGAAFGIITRRPAVAAGSAMALGLLKEFRDMRHNGFDWLDLAADAIGAGAATLLTSDLVR